MSRDKLEFNERRSQELFDQLVDLVEEADANHLEAVFAVSNTLYSLGATIYDGDYEEDVESLAHEYSYSPSWGAALMLISASIGETFGVLSGGMPLSEDLAMQRLSAMIPRGSA